MENNQEVQKRIEQLKEHIKYFSDKEHLSIGNLLQDLKQELEKMENNLADKILKSNGKIMTVKFIKKDGSLRVMNCRLGVTKHLKGGCSTLNPDKFITVYDLKSEGYRAIDKDSILDVKGV